MLYAFDSYYFDDKAKTVCFAFENWTDENPLQIFTEIIESNEEYEPGAFYKKELPCILDVLTKINLKNEDIIIVDSYVILDDEGKFGLGGYLYEKLDKKNAIIGVAKTRYARNTLHVAEVLRGESKNPLFVTAIGTDLQVAAENVKNMAGEYRIPTILKKIDTLTKE